MLPRFKRQVANPLTEISELQVFVDTREEEDGVLIVSSDVRIASVVGDIGGRDFKYGPRRASLRFVISGCEATRGARFNDSPPEPMEISEVLREAITNEKSTGLHAAAGIGASLQGTAASFGLNGEIGSKATSVAQLERTSSARKLSKFVKSRPNLRWEFEPRNGDDPASFLDDTYLAQHEMFSAEVSHGANKVSVDGLLYCRKRDFSIIAVEKKRGDGFTQSKNREAIMNLVLQKALKEAEVSTGLLGEEYIVLSKCTVSDSDED